MPRSTGNTGGGPRQTPLPCPRQRFSRAELWNARLTAYHRGAAFVVRGYTDPHRQDEAAELAADLLRLPEP